MDSKEKIQLSEVGTCDLFITPAIKTAGWDQLTQIRREVTLTPGPVVVRIFLPAVPIGILSPDNRDLSFRQ